MITIQQYSVNKVGLDLRFQRLRPGSFVEGYVIRWCFVDYRKSGFFFRPFFC